jgi:hypothetical protein
MPIQRTHRGLWNVSDASEINRSLSLRIFILLSFLVAGPFQVAQAVSAEVKGGFGCDRGSPGAVCFVDGTCMCGFLLTIDGEIDSATVDKVQKLFDIRRAHKGEGDEGFDINSRGGNVAAAMAIGRMFRKERAWLTVSNNGVCVVLILAGAVERVFLERKVGIHRPYLTTVPRTPMTAEQVKNAYRGALQEMRSYLREMNVSDRLANDMLTIEPENVRYLTEVELSRYGLSGVDPAEQETRAIEKEVQNVQEANQLGLERREYTRRKALGESLCSNLTVPQEEACKRRILRTGRP